MKGKRKSFYVFIYTSSRGMVQIKAFFPPQDWNQRFVFFCLGIKIKGVCPSTSKVCTRIGFTQAITISHRCNFHFRIVVPSRYSQVFKSAHIFNGIPIKIPILYLTRLLNKKALYGATKKKKKTKAKAQKSS